MGADRRLARYAFICCAPEDSAAGDVLQASLEDAGIEVWRDADRILPGEDWRLVIRRMVSDGTLTFVALFSRAGLAAEPSRYHEELNLAIEQLRQRRPSVPWLIPVRIDDSEIPDLDIGAGRTLRSLECADVFGSRREAGIKRLVATVARIQDGTFVSDSASGRDTAVSPVAGYRQAGTHAEQSGDADTHLAAADAGSPKMASQRQIAVRSPVGWRTVPEGTPNFIGREGMLFELTTALGRVPTPVMPMALCGLGGVGKTQLAIQYAWRSRSEYDLVWWVDAENRNQILSSFGKLADVMGLPVRETQEQAGRTVLDILREHTMFARWLLIYDNAESPEYALPYIPYGAGAVIVTSQNPEWGEVAKVFAVDVFTREESTDLLRQFCPDIADQPAGAIADRLGGLALAVEQAGIWLQQTGMDPAEYLSELDRYLLPAVRRLRSLQHPKPVVETWGLAFERLAGEDEAAASLLRLCAFFGPEPVSTWILRAGRHVPELPEALGGVLGDNFQLHDAIRKIGRYGLASASGAALRVHRLVQAVLRDLASEADQVAYRQFVHLILAAANPGAPDDTQNWPMLSLVGAHVVRGTGLIESDRPEVRQVVIDQVRYRYLSGDYEGSRLLAERAKSMWEEMHPAAALTTSYHLGNALRRLGQYREALKIDRETLTRLETTPEPDQGLQLQLTSSYAADLRINGNFQEAFDLDQRNVETFTNLYGPTDRNTLRMENNLAFDLRLKGEFGRALAHDEKILAVRARTFGAEDHDTLLSQCMRARDLRGCGQYREAIELYESALPKYRDLLGETHQDVLHARLSFAVTLCRAGELERSREEADDCLEAFVHQFGNRYPGSMMARTITASPLRLLGYARLAHAQASAVYRDIRDLFGDDHMVTAIYAHNLAITHRASGEFETALLIDQAAKTRFEEVLGPRHQHSLASLASLASSLSGYGDIQGALALSQQAHQLSHQVRGPAHPLTLMSACNLRLDIAAANQNAQTPTTTSQALAQLATTLGQDNPLVRMAEAGQRYEFDIEPHQA